MVSIVAAFGKFVACLAVAGAVAVVVGFASVLLVSEVIGTATAAGASFLSQRVVVHRAP